MRYYIFQLPSSSEYLFSPYNEKRKVDLHDYVPTYTGEISSKDNLSNENLCESLFQRFNYKLPEHFAGHSLSVSDIIALGEDVKSMSYYYCDMVGFKKIKVN